MGHNVFFWVHPNLSFFLSIFLMIISQIPGPKDDSKMLRNSCTDLYVTKIKNNIRSYVVFGPLIRNNVIMKT